MTKKSKGLATRHPANKSLVDMLAEDDALKAKAPKDGGIAKTATLVKAADDGITAVAFSRPNEEQLEKINAFTLTPKTADQLYVFDTLSMNDLPDRDDDVFTTETVEGFAALPQPFSPIGKSYMVDHEYKVGNARGRIFDTKVEKVSTEMGEATFLRNSIYIPDTPQYADFIEAQDFGVNWAVSVGVTLGATECSVCGEAFSSWGYWCRSGHDKGLSYDPNSNETDDWGYPLPCDPDDPKAVKCLRKFLDPRDFYELSQVFLGAQYFAALDKKAAGALSTAKTAGGFLSVPKDVAKEIEFSHEPDRVREARLRFGAALDAESGDLVWTDDHGIGWTFDPLDAEAKVLCTGRKSADEEESNNNDDEEVNSNGSTEAGEELGAPDESGDDEAAQSGEGSGEGSEASEDGSEGGGGPVPVADDASGSSDSGSEDGSGSDEDDDSGEKDDEDDDPDDASSSDADKGIKQASKESEFLSLLPESLRAGVKGAQVRSALAGYIKSLEVNAEYGKEYVKGLTADALAWYTRANFQPGDRGVNTGAFEKMLARMSDDPELLKEIISEQKEIAQKRFPARARRSSTPATDPNTPKVAQAIGEYDSSEVGDVDAEKTRRRHVE